MKKEYQLHREKIASKMDDKSIFVLFANKDSEINLEPNKNFLYATNIKENEDILIIEKNKIIKSQLFIQPYDEFKAKWVGESLNKEEAFELSEIQDVKYINQFEGVLASFLNNGYKLYLDIEPKELNDNKLKEFDLFVENIKRCYPYAQILNGRPFIQSARTIKTDFEVNQIKEGIRITNLGLLNLLDNLKAGLYEYQIESYFDQKVKFEGQTSYSFTTIAASGENACCLHYEDNNTLTKNGDLILFDLGSTKDYYCADISRTYPLNGKYSERQRMIYNIVLKGQELVMSNIKPGLTTRDLNNILVDYYKKELRKIGLIKDDSEVSKYYYHGVSHHLGLDCHDLCDYTPLEAGAVITVEPGLYIKEEGIGIRIEDDVLVTENGCINLSKEIIKSVEDIEAYLNK